MEFFFEGTLPLAPHIFKIGRAIAILSSKIHFGKIFEKLPLPNKNCDQCNTNIKFSTEYEYEYIRNGKFHRIRISNIFVFCKLVEYEYRIYSFLANGRIRISNIFVLRKFVEYEYRIYSKQEN